MRFYRNLIRWKSSCFMRTDGRTNMTLRVAFRSFANAPSNPLVCPQDILKPNFSFWCSSHVWLPFFWISPHGKPMQEHRGGTRSRWVVSTTLPPLYPRERPDTHRTGGWVGLGSGLDVRKNFSSTGNFFFLYLHYLTSHTSTLPLVTKLLPRTTILKSVSKASLLQTLHLAPVNRRRYPDSFQNR